MATESERIKRLLFCFAGSKYGLAPQLVSRFPPHDIYISPFLGTGAEFAFKEPSRREIAGDKDDNV
jgi:DNA adenine methylase